MRGLIFEDEKIYEYDKIANTTKIFNTKIEQVIPGLKHKDKVSSPNSDNIIKLSPDFTMVILDCFAVIVTNNLAINMHGIQSNPRSVKASENQCVLVVGEYSLDEDGISKLKPDLFKIFTSLGIIDPLYNVSDSYYTLNNIRRYTKASGVGLFLGLYKKFDNIDELRENNYSVKRYNYGDCDNSISDII